MPNKVNTIESERKELPPITAILEKVYRVLSALFRSISHLSLGRVRNDPQGKVRVIRNNEQHNWSLNKFIYRSLTIVSGRLMLIIIIHRVPVTEFGKCGASHNKAMFEHDFVGAFSLFDLLFKVLWWLKEDSTQIRERVVICWHFSRSFQQTISGHLTNRSC